MKKITQINKEDLASVLEARAKAVELAAAAEKTLKDARVAELEFKVEVQQLYISKGLENDCKIDISTGNVTWPEDVKVEEESKKTTKKTAKKTTKKEVNK